ncbi:nitric oxide reductase transcription regulator, partial [Ideonella dechloratans]
AGLPAATPSEGLPVDPARPALPPRQAARQAQAQSIRAALDAAQGNWAQAARALGVDPSNLHKLARRLGLK